MKKLFLMAVAAIMATMTFAQSYEWKRLTDTAKPGDFVNVSQEVALSVAAKDPECLYVFNDNGDGTCSYCHNDQVSSDFWEDINLDYVVYYPAAKPEPEPVDLVIYDARMTDNCSTQGWWQMMAQNADWYITLSNTGNVAQAAGTYTLSDLDLDYSFVQTIVDGKGQDKYILVDANLTVVTNGNVYVITGTVRGKIKGGEETVVFNINLATAEPEPTAIVNNENQNENQKVIENGQLIIIRDGVRYNAMGQVVE